MRREVFYANLAIIEAHNAGNHGWTMGLGEFTDLTSDEFSAARFTGYVPEPDLRRRIAAVRSERAASVTGRSLRSSVTAPAPVYAPVPSTAQDWSISTRNSRGILAVSAVQNQADCVAGWAFAATGAIEGNGALFPPPTGSASLVTLAVQQMKGCASKAAACAGGRLQQGLQWAINNAGMCSNASYAPFSPTNDTCLPLSCQAPQSKIKSYVNCSIGDVPCLQSAAAVKPVAVAVDGRSILLQHYTTGVITATCTNNLEHSALVVGYGNWTNVGRTPYWKLKNSWGSWWGDAGYFRVARGPAYDGMNGGFGVCGLYGIPSYPSF